MTEVNDFWDRLRILGIVYALKYHREYVRSIRLRDESTHA